MIEMKDGTIVPDMCAICEHLPISHTCSGCVLETCKKEDSSRCKMCRRFYADNYSKTY